ncbi:hypothetical protein CR513_04390, partial [Mucuna pruriens]
DHLDLEILHIVLSILCSAAPLKESKKPVAQSQYQIYFVLPRICQSSNRVTLTWTRITYSLQLLLCYVICLPLPFRLLPLLTASPILYDNKACVELTAPTLYTIKPYLIHNSLPTLLICH